MSVKTFNATVNGTTLPLSYNSETGKYEAQFTAPADSSYTKDGGYYDISLIATDSAGNSSTANSSHATLGDSLKLYVKETNKPVITELMPDTYVTNSFPTISFKIVDNDKQTSGYSGVDKSSVVLKINGTEVETSKISWTDTEGGYIGTYTPTTAIEDGDCVVTVDGSDFDGNAADTATVTFIIDTVSPTLSLKSPVNGLETNESQILIEGTTDDITSKPITIKVTVNGTDQGAVTVNNDGTFSKVVSVTTEGEYAIKVTATDKAGHETSVTRTVVYDITPPNIKSVTIEPSNHVTTGQVYKIIVEVE